MLLQLGCHLQHKSTFVQAIHPQIDAGEIKQAPYNLFAAYVHLVPLEELIESGTESVTLA